MVRPDEISPERLSRELTSGFAGPAGASPVQADTGVPGSRSQARSESAVSRAGRQEPGKQLELFTGEQARGRQHEVKPAASTEKQRESRAAHFTAKATFTAARSGHQTGVVDLPGVEGVARVQGAARNRRDPSAVPSSGQERSYKAKSKASAAQRKSEGVVVPSMAATNNAVGGKGPCFGHADGEGKREGMVGSLRPNTPFDDTVEVKAPQPQGPLQSRAKRLACGSRPTDTLSWRDNHRNPRRSRRPSVQARTRGPSASRVRENRKHGLTGGPESSSSKTTVLRR